MSQTDLEHFCRAVSSIYQWRLHNMDRSLAAAVFASGFHRLGTRILNSFINSRLRAVFGVTPKVCAIIWGALRNDLANWESPKHILWCLLFLKCYTSDCLRKPIVNADEKAFRKWSLALVHLIAPLLLVRFRKWICAWSTGYSSTTDQGIYLAILMGTSDFLKPQTRA